MKLTKEQKEMLRGEFAHVWHESDSMIEHSVKICSACLDLGDIVLTTEKPHIRTEFWFGEHTYDYDEVAKRCELASKSEEYFISQNMKWEINSPTIIDALENKDYHVYTYKPKYTCQDDECRLAGFQILREWETNGKEYRRLTDEETAAFIQMHKEEVEKFEKRLRTYLKRYGLSKCRYGMYWADR